MHLQTGTPTNGPTGTAVLSPNTTYLIEYLFNSNGTNTIKINGATDLNQSVNFFNSNWTRLAFRAGYSPGINTSVQFYFDDIALSSSGWIGNGKAALIKIGADGHYTPSSGTYSTIANNIPCSTSTFLSANATSGKYSATLTGIPNDIGVINALKVFAVYKGTGSQAIGVRIGGTDYLSSTDSAAGTHQYLWNTNPATGVAWTSSDLSSLEVLYSGPASAQLCLICAEIDYQVAIITTVQIVSSDTPLAVDPPAVAIGISASPGDTAAAAVPAPLIGLASVVDATTVAESLGTVGTVVVQAATDAAGLAEGATPEIDVAIVIVSIDLAGFASASDNEVTTWSVDSHAAAETFAPQVGPTDVDGASWQAEFPNLLLGIVDVDAGLWLDVAALLATVPSLDGGTGLDLGLIAGSLWDEDLGAGTELSSLLAVSIKTDTELFLESDAIGLLASLLHEEQGTIEGEASGLLSSATDAPDSASTSTTRATIGVTLFASDSDEIQAEQSAGSILAGLSDRGGDAGTLGDNGALLATLGWADVGAELERPTLVLNLTFTDSDLAGLTDGRLVLLGSTADTAAVSTFEAAGAIAAAAWAIEGAIAAAAPEGIAAAGTATDAAGDTEKAMIGASIDLAPADAAAGADLPRVDAATHAGDGAAGAGEAQSFLGAVADASAGLLSDAGGILAGLAHRERAGVVDVGALLAGLGTADDGATGADLAALLAGLWDQDGASGVELGSLGAMLFAAAVDDLGGLSEGDALAAATGDADRAASREPGGAIDSALATEDQGEEGDAAGRIGGLLGAGDAAGGGGAGSYTAAVVDASAGMLGDVGGVVAGLGERERAGAVDVGAVLAALGTRDGATGVDRPSLLAALADLDGAAAADLGELEVILFAAAADAGGGGDAAGLVAGPISGDASGGAERLGTIGAVVGDGDLGTVAGEFGTLGGSLTVAAVDAGGISEGVDIGATLAGHDGAAPAWAPVLVAALGGGDAGLGTDAAGLEGAPVATAGTDAAAGLEASESLAAAATGADRAGLGERIGLEAAAATAADSGAGLDTWGLLGAPVDRESLAVAESATGQLGAFVGAVDRGATGEASAYAAAVSAADGGASGTGFGLAVAIAAAEPGAFSDSLVILVTAVIVPDPATATSVRLGPDPARATSVAVGPAWQMATSVRLGPDPAKATSRRVEL